MCAGVDDSKVECCIGLTILKIWMIGKLNHFGNLCSFYSFLGSVLLLLLSLVMHCMAPVPTSVCDPFCSSLLALHRVWLPVKTQNGYLGFITLAQTSKETVNLRGLLWSRGMQDKKGKTVNTVGLLGLGD